MLNGKKIKDLEYIIEPKLTDFDAINLQYIKNDEQKKGESDTFFDKNNNQHNTRCSCIFSSSILI